MKAHKYLFLVICGLSLVLNACKDSSPQERKAANGKPLPRTRVEPDDPYYRDYWSNACFYYLFTALFYSFYLDMDDHKTAFLDSADSKKVFTMMSDIIKQRFDLVELMRREGKLIEQNYSCIDNLLSARWAAMQSSRKYSTMTEHAVTEVNKQIMGTPLLLDWLEKKGLFVEHVSPTISPDSFVKNEQYIERKLLSGDDAFAHKTSLMLFPFLQQLHTKLAPETPAYEAIPHLLLRTSFEYWLAKKAQLIHATPEDDACFLQSWDIISKPTLDFFRESMLFIYTYKMPEQWTQGTPEEQRQRLQALSEAFLKELVEYQKGKR